MNLFFIFLAGCFQRMQPYGSALRLANPKNQKKEDFGRFRPKPPIFPVIIALDVVSVKISYPNTLGSHQVISQYFQLKYRGILKEAFQEYI